MPCRATSNQWVEVVGAHNMHCWKLVPLEFELSRGGFCEVRPTSLMYPTKLLTSFNVSSLSLQLSNIRCINLSCAFCLSRRARMAMSAYSRFNFWSCTLSWRRILYSISDLSLPRHTVLSMLLAFSADAMFLSFCLISSFFNISRSLRRLQMSSTRVFEFFFLAAKSSRRRSHSKLSSSFFSIKMATVVSIVGAASFRAKSSVASKRKGRRRRRRR